MRAAILTIGDELTSGYRLDTDSQAIARRLAAVPLEVVLHATVGDNWEAIQGGLRIALESAEVVIVAGGLGPTEDDLTRQAVAAFFQRPLAEDPQALDRIRERFARRGRPMAERNRIQAQVPEGSQTIYNDRGTAAGFYLEEEGRHLFVVPGIPYEMEGMLEGFILPLLRERLAPDYTVCRGVLKVFGPPESEVAERIRPLLGRERNPLLGLLAHWGTITIEVVAPGATPREAEGLLAADMQTLREEFGEAVVCQDERELPQVVGDLLAQQGLTLSVAETVGGTGGLVTARLTSAAGSQRWFCSGAVDRLAGSEEEVRALAAQVRRDTGSGVGLATGALLGPGNAGSASSHRVVVAAADGPNLASCERFRYGGEPVWVRHISAEAVLNLLRLHLLRQPTPLV